LQLSSSTITIGATMKVLGMSLPMMFTRGGILRYYRIERRRRARHYRQEGIIIELLGSRDTDCPLTQLAEWSYFADHIQTPSYYESFGLVALESLACGTPVVATDVGNLKSVICQGETGYVVIDNAPHRLADKIALLLSRPSTDIASTVSIRASVSSFSWSNIAEAIIRECQLVLANYLAPVS